MARPASWFSALIFTRGPAAVVLIRLYVGLVFACEGVLKFLRPDSLGTGRFDKVGIPAPAFFSTLDGIFEIGCGVLILVGLLTRLAAVPMIINMLGALLITKLPDFLGAGSVVPWRARLVGLHPRIPR
ncbi:MAG: DoxX family protein [Mycobacterium sp.]|jgi:putative oxidoreductase|nr:DoxX family protein [Mycobacterium sp.]